MTRRWFAAAALVLVALTACARGSAAGSNATPTQVYSAVPTQRDVQGLLGSPDWWPTTPSFVVRPLDLPTLPQNLKFEIGSAFVHVGTPEILRIAYLAYASSSDASTAITNVTSQQSQTTTSPKVGDQSVYYGYKQPGVSSIYQMFAVVRVGLFVISVDLDQDAGFAALSLMAKIATRAVNRLKDVVGGKVHPSPLATSDTKLLPPPGPDVTLVGSARLPVEALVATLGASSPQQLVDSFHQMGVKDFLYGDYALDADLTMEVKTSLFTFPSASDSASFVESAAGGAANLDANGVSVGYSAAAGQYYGIFEAGPYAGIVYCTSTTPGQAASRACETPFTSLISSWQSSLTQ